MRGSTIALAIVVGGGLFLVAADVFGSGGLPLDTIAAVVALLAVAIFVGSGALRRYRFAPGSQVLQHLAIWLGIVVVLALLYSNGPTIMDWLGIERPYRVPAGPQGFAGLPAAEVPSLA